jgi:hypothetical protein
MSQMSPGAAATVTEAESTCAGASMCSLTGPESNGPGPRTPMAEIAP